MKLHLNFPASRFLLTQNVLKHKLLFDHTLLIRLKKVQVSQNISVRKKKEDFVGRFQKDSKLTPGGTPVLNLRLSCDWGVVRNDLDMGTIPLSFAIFVNTNVLRRPILIITCKNINAKNTVVMNAILLRTLQNF